MNTGTVLSRRAVLCLFASIAIGGMLSGCKSRAAEEEAARQQAERDQVIQNYNEQKEKMERINEAQQRVREAEKAAKDAGAL